MSRWRTWLLAGGLALGVMAQLGAAPASGASESPAVDPAAIRILEEMTDHLDGLIRFSVKTESTIEELHASGHVVDYDFAATVTVARPNRLRAERIGGLMNQAFYYDGKTLTLYSPVANVYAVEPAPGTVEETINFARETVGILLPAADLVYREAFPHLVKDLTLAVVVGKAIVGGVRCDQLLFSRPGVDFQIWVEEGHDRWPRKYVVTETDTPARLSIATFLTDWNLNPAAEEALFKFVPPKGASATRFIPYGTTESLTDGRKP